MAKVFALYKEPSDKESFTSYYFTKHAPLAKTMPGLRGYEVSNGTVMGANGPSDVFLTAVLTFDSMDAIQQAMASPEGQSTVADLSNFATGGVEIMICDTKTI
jgi:uncharacterized protein (TIGR02118 family)